MVILKDIEEAVKRTVARVFRKDVSEISHGTRFVQDLFAKSVNIIEITAILEYEFNIEIPRALSRKAGTVGETIELIADLVGKKPS